MAALFTRRHVLQSAMLMCGAILAPRRAAAAAAAAPAVLPGRLGLLLPQSGAGEAFLRGLRLALPDQPIAVERLHMGRAAVAEGARRLVAPAGGQLIGLMGPNLAARSRLS